MRNEKNARNPSPFRAPKNAEYKNQKSIKKRHQGPKIQSDVFFFEAIASHSLHLHSDFVGFHTMLRIDSILPSANSMPSATDSVRRSHFLASLRELLAKSILQKSLVDLKKLIGVSSPNGILGAAAGANDRAPKSERAVAIYHLAHNAPEGLGILLENERISA